MLLLPLTTFASGTTFDGEFDFEVDDIYYLILPDSIPSVMVCGDTWSHSAWGDYFGNSGLYSGNLIIPNSVTYNDTTYVVTSIHWDALMICEDLRSVFVPKCVTSIIFTSDGHMSDHTSNLNGIQCIQVDNGNTVYDSRNDCNAIIETASNQLVAGCNMTIIPNTVTSIGKSAFSFCSELEHIDIPNSINYIGNCAFYGCSNLISVIIPSFVTEIGAEAFRGCSNLVDITCMPLNPPTISFEYYNYEYADNYGNTFNADCYTNATLKVPQSSYDSYRSANGWKEFSQIQKISDLEIDGIYYEIISDNPPEVRVTCRLWEPDSLGDLYLPSSDYSGDLIVPSEVTFNGISYLVTSIHWGAFVSCTDLVSITLPASINDIKMAAYTTSFDLGPSIHYGGSNGLKNIKVLEGNSVYDSRNDCNAIIETATNKLIAGCNNTVVPNTVVSIGSAAFINCRELNSIILPNSITEIGASAFAGCSNLAEINIPNSVIDIGTCAFRSSGLTNCVLTNSLSKIKPGVFAGSHLSSLEIPNGVTEIGNYAFLGCYALASVSISKYVTNIGDAAFAGCSNLVDIICMALTPPSITYRYGWNTFDTGCYNSAILTVPRGYSDIYRTTNGWKEFSTIQALPPDMKVDDLYYVVTSDSTVCVTFKDDSYNSYSGDVVIPESVNYDGKVYIVNAIDEKAFYNCSGLTSVIIPNTITTIGDYAFYGCSGLTSLTIGKSVASIGYDAFNGCNNLKELNWNAINCSSNGNMSTSNIESVTIGSEVEVLPNYFVSGSKIAEVIIPNSVTWIGVSAFSACKDLLSIDIPNSVTVIDNQAFYYCKGLTNVTLDRVQTIGEYAFAECTGLKSIEFSDSLLYIYDRAFSGCSSLNSITIPNNVREIGQYAFNNCIHLTSVTIGNAVSTIGHYAFVNCYHLMSVNIPSSVTTIGSDAFHNCNALSKVTISDVSSWCKITFSDTFSNPLYYSHHLFMNGQEIKQLVIPEGVTAINSYAFVNGTSFLELTLPNTLESIGNNAFEGCKRLSNVALGLSMASIGSRAFKDCTAISSVDCMATTPPIMEAMDCFDSNCYDWATLYVPGDKVDEYKSTIYWNKFVNTFGTGIEVDGLYYLFDLEKGEASVTYKDETYCSYTDEVIIPETVNYGGAEYTITGIGKAAFAYCDELMSVTIPHTVTSIGDYAFMYCEGLTSITIPDSVKSIGDNSFDGCGALCAVEIPNSVISIGDMAFQGCTSLTDITIGSGVTNIGAKAFNYCNSLHSVTCMGSVPPLMDNSDCFTSYGYEATLKVPQTSIEDYQSSNYWYKFAVIEGFGGVEPGDVDGDGNLNISDVTALIDLLLSGGEALPSSDVNGDGQVNISDVTALIDMLLSGN